MRFKEVLLGAIAVAALAGCSSGGGDAQASGGASGGTAPTGGSEKKLTIAVIPKGSTHEFWKSLHEGAEKAATELGVDIEWKGPIKEDDREDQVKTVEDFTTRHVDGIVLAPLDETALRKPVEEAINSDIPVVIVDSGLKDAKTVSFVATDNYKGGQMAGEEMIRLLNGKGKIVVLRYQVGSASTMERERGFLDAVKGKLQVVSENQYAGATVETAQKASENLLAPLKSGDGLSVDGIFTPNESSTFGMLRTLQDGGLAGKVKFVGFDVSAKLLEALKADQLNGIIVQNPRNMGYLGVKTLVAHIKGEKVEDKIDTGATLVTKENMDKPEVQELLAPPKI